MNHANSTLKLRLTVKETKHIQNNHPESNLIYELCRRKDC